MKDLKNILEEYRNKEYLFRDEPRKLEKTDYDKAADEVISSVSRIEDVCSIYALTEGGVPGVSDLDLMIILKNNFENSKGESYHSSNFSETVRYTLDSALQRKDLFSKLYYRYYYRWAAETNTLRCLYGQEIEPEKISEKDIYLSKLYYLAGILFTKMPRDLLRSLTTGKISVRGLLQVIYTLKFSVALESQITGIPSQPAWVKFVEDFDEFRQEWFKMGEERYQRLIDALIEATVISWQLVGEFSSHLRKENIIPSWPNSGKNKFLGAFTGYKFCTIFYDSTLLSSSQALKLNLDINEKEKIRAILLPSEFAAYLWQLSRASQGVRTEYIARNLLLPEEEPAVPAPPEIRHREDLFNQYLDFMIKGNALATNPGGAQELFGFYSGSGLKYQLKKRIRDILHLLMKGRTIKYLKSQKV